MHETFWLLQGSEKKHFLLLPVSYFCLLSPSILSFMMTIYSPEQIVEIWGYNDIKRGDSWLEQKHLDDKKKRFIVKR